MPEVGEEIDEAERVAALADRHRDAWERTLEDAQSLAENRAEEEGWDTLVIPAGDTAPETKEAGKFGRFGLTHVIPSNFADDMAELTDGDFSGYDAYRAESDGRVFLVTELLSPEEEVAIYVVGTYELQNAGDLIQEAAENGVMYTHLQRLDGTHVTSVAHEKPEKFFPNMEQFLDDAEE
jgi:hypothetical protein